MREVVHSLECPLLKVPFKRQSVWSQMCPLFRGSTVIDTLAGMDTQSGKFVKINAFIPTGTEQSIQQFKPINDTHTHRPTENSSSNSSSLVY